ncbi:MAG TPA: (2Fe-2S)-binding protein [Verrucomicrobiae bacterium]|nr:(2Fe-2S)-binding protein [Verrucomicrobiae bacterium]
MSGQLLRLAETDRRPIRITLGDRTIEALEGDTLLTALLLAQGHLRVSDFGDGPRAGFCLMGACQDCWVALADGRRLRACTTLAEDGMALEPIP